MKSLWINAILGNIKSNNFLSIEKTKKMSIPIYYSRKHINLGDAINPILLRNLFHVDTHLVKYHKAEFFAVGSILEKVTSPRYDLGRRIKGYFQTPATIWSSGFLVPPTVHTVLCRKLKIAALRGKLSQGYLEKLLGHKIEVPLGDGGLLMPKLLTELPPKQIQLGIIPHHSEVGSAQIQRLLQKFPQAVIISPEIFGNERIEERLLELLRKIASCEMIFSTSLHGIVAADAFGIPCRHLICGQLPEGTFKFNDYRSAFGLTDVPVEINELLHGTVSLSEIFQKNQLSSDQVAEVSENIQTAFPRF
ncbi:MAG: polysaccharide pyruvyl transferase family protein [Victivallaceae bacterium]|nr:polysaccharide pyruvyl transferase family protein [Victivallaceae bacterium]